MGQESEQLSELAARFVRPAAEHGPVPMWWWSGEPLDAERLRWQLEQLAEGGVGGVVVMNLAPTGPLYGSDADDPAFFSDGWWTHFRAVCARARELGVGVWFYDQIGFSGANFQADLVTRHPEHGGLALDSATVTSSDAATLECPPEGEPLGAWATPVDHAGAATGPAVPVPLTGRQARWSGAAQAHRVTLCYSAPRGYDYLNPAACQALLRRVHGEFDAKVGDFFGDPILGSFQDELPTLPTWSREFAAVFADRHGYDLLPHLIALCEHHEHEGPDAARVRHDYHETRAALAEEAFFRPLHQWHSERGLVCGVDQQDPARAGAPVEAVRIYADYPRTHRWYGAPGSDHHGDAKIHSSLAHLYQRPHTWVEAFHSTGWGGTLEETFDWLLPWLRAGVTLYNPHAVYYSTRGGWWEWAPPSTCWRQPYWRHYHRFAETVRRLSAVLSHGDHVCDVGVLFPGATVQSGVTLDAATPEAALAHRTYLDIVGVMRWFEVRTGALDALRRDFDVLDDDSVRWAEVADGQLRIGAESYRVVVLPACVALEADTAVRLVEFMQAGGRVIAVGALPERAAGRGADDSAPRRLADLIAQAGTLIPTPGGLAAALADLPGPVDAPVPTLLRRSGDATVLFVPAISHRATEMEKADHEILPWFRIGYRFDPAAYQREMTVTVRGVAGEPQLWEPYSGRRRRLAADPTPDGVTVRVPFDDTPGALLVWGDPSACESVTASISTTAPPAAATAPAAAGDSVITTLNADWEVELAPTLDNRWGDLALPAHPGPPLVQCWEVEHRVERDDGGEDGWRPAYASFGPHGEQRGPDPDDPWRPAIYSDSRGLRKDQLHEATLGPKGHVPEEFLDFGRVPRDGVVRFSATVHVAGTTECHLAIGAAASKRAWLDGRELDLDDPGYLAFAPVALAAGRHTVELALRAEQDGKLRAHLAFTTDVARYRRPEWLTTSGPNAKDSTIEFSRDVVLPDGEQSGQINVASPAPCRLLVNGVEIGRQGGFDPYYESQGVTRMQTYHLGSALRPGGNRIAVEMTSIGGAADGVLLDALFTSRDAGKEAVGKGAGGKEQVTSLASDLSWRARRDGQPVTLALRRQQWWDPAAACLWRRPHPLPAASWIDLAGGAPGVVLPLLLCADTQEWSVEQLRFTIPPGAVRMRIPAYGQVAVQVDDADVPCEAVTGDGRTAPSVLDVALTPGDGAARQCVLRVVTAPGRSGGGILAGPVEFHVGAGRMGLGDWSEQGLAAYSGGVAYRATLRRDQPSQGRVLLDLGRVRGTAEVSLNGRPVGVRIWSPYVFELPAMAAGEHILQIRVDNTLAPHIDAVSPTHYVFDRQCVSGLFGPARLIETPEWQGT